METLTSLYQEHLDTLQQRAREALARHQLDALLIHSGELLPRFLDDIPYPFRVNPHFKAWVPVTDVANCWLWIDGVNPPRLWYYAPEDYWHFHRPLPDTFWSALLAVTPLTQADAIDAMLPADRQRVAYIGPASARARALGIAPDNINPDGVLNYLHYYRAFKTRYELHCLREAQKIAVSGHQAAQEAFLSRQSEFDINSIYLMATGQRDTDVPYDNIIALNEHAAVLHYTGLDKHTPTALHSFLIDAGAEFYGYAADITRTYAAQADGLFAELISAVNQAQQALIATLKAGVRYTDYHQDFQYRLAAILRQHQLVEGMSEEALVAEKVVQPFFPHGLGHLLGLQVHDVAGFMQDDAGTTLAPPSEYPALRCTRLLAPGMVVTIEPGLYFIESLLAPWREGPYRQHLNWALIDTLKPCGGIRIEDNVVIHENRIENLTRDLKLA